MRKVIKSFPNRLFQIFKFESSEKSIETSAAEVDDLPRPVHERLAVEQKQQRDAHALRELPARQRRTMKSVCTVSRMQFSVTPTT